MPKKSLLRQRGFVHLFPLLIVVIFLVGGFSLLSVRQEQTQKEAVGKVLSSSDEGDDDDKSSSGGSSSSGPGSAGTTSIESRTDEGRTKVETTEGRTEIEVRNKEGRFETKLEEDEEETKIRTGGVRVEIKREGDRVVIKFKNENDEEVELEDEEEEELLEEIDDDLREEGIRIATDSAGVSIIQNGRRVRTNFPLSVNPATGELFVSTPAGEKVVAILPEVAIGNMIAAGILTRVVEEPPVSPSPPPVEGTGAAAPGKATGEALSATGAGIELTTVGDEPVYLITGVKSENFLGFLSVEIKVKAAVSATDGNLLDLEQGFLARFLDLLSF